EPTPEFVVLPAKPGEAINQLLAIQKEAFDDEKPASLDRLLELNDKIAEISKQFGGNKKIEALAGYTLVQISETIEAIQNREEN
ncbi:MAG: hypothetical protein PHG97_01680, partial [Candidatus Margulisbacteria bacterium]|nr:hypothetical protein [Candidatus Margulisiibacteriota bacterium]